MNYLEILGLTVLLLITGLCIGFFLPKSYVKIIDMFSFSFTTSRRYLRSFVTPILGVGIAIMIFTSMFAVLDGMKLTIQGAELPSVLVVREKGEAFSYTSTLNMSIREIIAEINHVEQVSPMVSGFTMDTDENFHLLRGVEFETYRKVVQDIKITQGRFINSSDPEDVAIVGKQYFEHNNMTLGGYTLELFSEKPPFEKKWGFKIVGEFESGTMKDSEIWMNLNRCRTLVDMKDNETSIFMVKVESFRFLENVTNEIEAKIENVEATLESKEWKFMDEVYEQFLVLIQLMVLATFVTAVIGIMNVMINLIDERKRDIAVLKSIGFSNSFIFGIFSLQSIFVGLLGGLTGVLISIIVFRIVGLSVYVTGFGFNLILTDQTIFDAIIFSGLIGWISSLYPVYKTVRIRPVEILRM